MRVLMVSDVYFPRINGVSTAIETYRRTLASHGIEVKLIAPDYDQPCDQPWITRVKGRAIPRDPEDRLVRWRALNDTLETAAADCDLIHVQTPFLAHYAAERVARRRNLPLIATYHTLFEEYFHHYAPFLPASWLRGAARRFSRTQCDALNAVIVPSRAIESRLREYGVSTPLHILPTGVPLSQFTAGDRQRFRTQHGIAPDRPVALYVGRVAHEKNLDFLLEVAALARRQVPDILLLITGEGPALPHLRREVVRLGLENHVQFIGYLNRQQALPDCYAAADAFVFASRTETQGLVLIEAMAMGLPVVALSAMGTADILRDGQGARVPHDHPEDFASKLGELLLDGNHRRQLADSGKIHAEQWSDTVLAGRLAGLYRDIAADHRKQSND